MNKIVLSTNGRELWSTATDLDPEEIAELDRVLIAHGMPYNLKLQIVQDEDNLKENN